LFMKLIESCKASGDIRESNWRIQRFLPIHRTYEDGVRWIQTSS